MKTRLLGSIGLALALVFGGCNKADEVASPTSTKTVGQASFEEQMTYLLPLLDAQHDLEIKTVRNPAGEAVLVFYFVPRDTAEGASRQIVCQGSGVGFIRCCQGWYDAHPGKCLKVTRDDRTGVYSADDNC